MGPLLPPLLLVPILLVAAWAFDDVLIVWGVPILTVGLVAFGIWIIYDYQRHYARLARNGPDRLQSEKFRYATAHLQMMAAKGLSYPLPVDSFEMGEPRTNEAEHEQAATKTDDGEKMS